MANFDITSANATAVLTVEKLFPAGIQLQMFSTNQAVSQKSVDIAQTRMGVDGKMVAGYAPSIYEVTIKLEAASPSAESLGLVWQAMKTTKGMYECALVCSVPSIGKVYTWTGGVLKSGEIMPALAQTLEPTTWTFHFENMDLAGL